MYMSDVTRILSAIEQGAPHAAEKLLPLVYDELRKLAAQKLAQEKPGQTLQPTALVHEAYLRLVDVDQAQHWDSRGPFFAAAAASVLGGRFLWRPPPRTPCWRGMRPCPDSPPASRPRPSWSNSATSPAC